MLPFVNVSADKEQEYFSDGLSEELLDSLAKVHDLQVAARTSSFSFKGEHVELADIARKLNVGALLEGSVRRDGTHVRITAQLINALTGFHLWSGNLRPRSEERTGAANRDRHGRHDGVAGNAATFCSRGH